MKVAVIMSTYNGKKYLREQIISILNQSNVHLDLYIRDDGSVDGTIELLEEYSSHFQIYVEFGKNLGFRRSFITKLLAVSDYDYYAFSDQDDFWESEKLIQAIRLIESGRPEENLPVVYYSNLKVSDENLNVYRITSLHKRKKSLASIIMRRSVAGCTMVLNQMMWQTLADKTITDDMLARGHDSFILSLCYAIGGTVVCDKNAYIKYRQHTSNTSGSSYGVVQRLRKEWNAIVAKKGCEVRIANSILDTWTDKVVPNQADILYEVIHSQNSIISRAKIMFSRKFTTGDIRTTIIGKMRAVLGLL